MRSKHKLTQDAPPQHCSWQEEISWYVDKFGGETAREHQGTKKRCSSRTREARGAILFLAFNQLRDMKRFGGLRPCNVTPKHVMALMQKWETEGLSGATLQDRFSKLRTFSVWIGKPGMLSEGQTYLVDPFKFKRTYKATRDKSWGGNSVNFWDVIKEIEKVDIHVAMQLLLIALFGLRRKEGVMFQPFRSIQQVGGATILNFGPKSGTKGGRARVVPVFNDEQRAALEKAKGIAKTANGHIGDPNLTLEQSLSHFSYVIRKFGITVSDSGVTAHGLRHQYVHRRIKELTGIDAPIKGGLFDCSAIEKEVLLTALYTVSEELGHSRLPIMTAYAGGFVVPNRPDVTDKIEITDGSVCVVRANGASAEF